MLGVTVSKPDNAYHGMWDKPKEQAHQHNSVQFSQLKKLAASLRQIETGLKLCTECFVMWQNTRSACVASHMRLSVKHYTVCVSLGTHDLLTHFSRMLSFLQVYRYDPSARSPARFQCYLYLNAYCQDDFLALGAWCHLVRI